MKGTMQYAQGRERIRALADLLWQSRLPTEINNLCAAGLGYAVDHTGAVAGCVRLFGGSGQLSLIASRNCDADYLRDYPAVDRELELIEPVLGRFEIVTVPGGEGPESLVGMRRLSSGGWLRLVPILSAGGAQGLLTLLYAGEAPPSHEADDWLCTLCTLLGTAVTNTRLFNQVDEQSRTDELTGLGTRRHFEELLKRELARARRAGTAVSLAMLDVDGLKQINDKWGHVVGDQVLRAVGEILGQVRATDVAARFGGDEFVLLMPDTTAKEAERVAARIRRSCEKINQEGRLPVPLRLSIGIRQMTHLEGDLVAEADAAMYADKRSTSAPLPRDIDVAELEEEEAYETQARE
jgi:diguanylate cyclase (GGDEF)-like protein